MRCDHFLGQIIFIAWIHYFCLSIHHLVILLFVYLYNIAVNIHRQVLVDINLILLKIYVIYIIYIAYIIYVLHIYYIYILHIYV